jgi:transposase InsO family protein
MDDQIRMRLKWVQLYEELGNAGVVCLRCGISRPTLRKWWSRYQEKGIDGLQEESRRPKSSPAQKVQPVHEQLISDLRKRKLGHRRIQNELNRLHNISLSTATIHKVLERLNKQYLKHKRTFRKHVIRYSRPVPGDRVQMDVCKIAPGIYQYTAIDDCSRYKVLRLYSRRTANNTMDFFDAVIEEMPFAIQRIQTDRGREFFATQFQQRLLDWGIKFRPIKPASPYLNGKVERSQRTDLDEFYSTVDLKDPDLQTLLAEWQHYYNWDRPHSSLDGKTPIERLNELSDKTLLWEEVAAKFDPSKERIQEQNYRDELALRKLK